MAALCDAAVLRFGVTLDALLSPCRDTALVEARDWAAMEGFDHGLSTKQIGRGINRDHASVMAGINREAVRRNRLATKAERDLALTPVSIAASFGVPHD